MIASLLSPHSGTWYAYLGDLPGHFNALGSVHQVNVSIPASATSATLAFWLNTTTNETTDSTAFDLLDVNLRNPLDDSLIQKLATYSNLDKVLSGNVPGTYALRMINLTAFRGQTFTLQFFVDTDGSNETIFRIDDVNLAVTY